MKRTNDEKKEGGNGAEAAGSGAQAQVEEAMLSSSEEAEIEETGWEKIGRLTSELEEKTAEANALSERFLRLAADTDNYKKRAEKEKADAITLANESLIAEILPVLDNLERALAHAEEASGDDKSLHKGVVLTMEQLRSVLKKFGLSEVSAVGGKFDPALHHAISHEEAEGAGPDLVVKEFQKGYFLKGKLIRPALVAVSKGK